MKRGANPQVLLILLPPSGGDLFPVSLGYIAASLIRQGIDTRLVDLTSGSPKSQKEVIDLAGKLQPQLIGFSAYQLNIRETLSLASLIRRKCKKSTIILGGPQAASMPKEALASMPSVDLLCRGEGEVVLPALSRALTAGGGERVNGLVFRGDKGCIQTQRGGLTKNLDDFPSPYQAKIFDFSAHNAACMLSARGCAFNCHFCCTPGAFGRSLRYHSSERIIDDMDICIKNNIREFFFADASFTMDKRRVAEIMRGIIKKRWKIRFWCQTHTDLIDRDTLSLMARAGATAIAYGLESVDKKVMKAINKEIDLDRFRRVVKMTQGAGITPEIFTIYGLPKQSYDSARRTLEFVKSLKVKILGNSQGQQLSLYFGTKFSGQAERFGFRSIKRRRPRYLSIGREFETAYMNRKEILKLKEFYSAEGFLDAALPYRNRRKSMH